MPLAFEVPLAVRDAPNFPLGPDPGAVKVTLTPLIGLPPLPSRWLEVLSQTLCSPCDLGRSCTRDDASDPECRRLPASRYRRRCS